MEFKKGDIVSYNAGMTYYAEVIGSRDECIIIRTLEPSPQLVNLYFKLTKEDRSICDNCCLKCYC